jgi:hypothetical protein
MKQAYYTSTLARFLKEHPETIWGNATGTGGAEVGGAGKSSAQALPHSMTSSARTSTVGGRRGFCVGDFF